MFIGHLYFMFCEFQARFSIYLFLVPEELGGLGLAPVALVVSLPGCLQWARSECSPVGERMLLHVYGA